MAEERPKIERVRLFVALDLPELVRAEIGGWGRQELTDPALRPVPVENLHITLAFLGSRPHEDVEPVVEAVRECAGAAPIVSLMDVAARPARRPRVFGLPAISPGAEILQAALSERLVAEDLYKPEKRPFWPHVTVARVRSEGRGSRRPMRVEKFPDELPAGLLEPFLGVRLALYRSELQPSGARYVPLAQVELPG
ncbi:MAG TPA: RNA 2',3'-cyclic phosphodiesterase [Solirubrobacterales bacterium]|nr:RNA 2',3'-cyclic phosphodiesterase [Solirubrobacterales bacterium]